MPLLRLVVLLMLLRAERFYVITSNLPHATSMDARSNMKKSYGNTGTPITMDMGGFKVYYRNHVGGARQAFFKVADHNEARNETLNLYGGSIDDSPVRIERMDVFGNHTHTWYSENIWDSCLKLIGRGDYV